MLAAEAGEGFIIRGKGSQRNLAPKVWRYFRQKNRLPGMA
jgi:hypothetical protein